MRELIKVRGKSKETGQWVYGGYYMQPPPNQCVKTEEPPQHYIVHPQPHWIADWGMPIPMMATEVDGDTVGIYIGSDDKHNKEIYEGDIVDCLRDGDEENWTERAVVKNIKNLPRQLFGSSLISRTIVGNIYDGVSEEYK